MDTLAEYDMTWKLLNEVGHGNTMADYLINAIDLYSYRSKDPKLSKDQRSHNKILLRIAKVEAIKLDRYYRENVSPNE